MAEINWVNVIMIMGFFLPIFTGVVGRLSRERLNQTVRSWIDNLGFLLALTIAIYLIRKIFFENETGIFAQIYGLIPYNVQNILLGQDILLYILLVPLLLVVIKTILRIITIPLGRIILEPLTNSLYNWHDSQGRILSSMLGGLYQLPGAVIIVFLLGIFFNFFAYYFPTPLLSGWMNESPAYQIVYNHAVAPALNSNIAKKIPVLVNDSFGKAIEKIQPIGTSDPQLSLDPMRTADPRVITYFNGVSLDEAIKSNEEIDATARQVVGSEENSVQQGYLLYQWISRNIDYDYDKAALISQDSEGIASGAITAFNTRTGICFDHSSLYIAMCRAVGLKVRLISGLGYSGLTWGDHAWNQVHADEEGRWINVDTTFGIGGNYFDKKDFYVDHRYAVIQGEW